MRHNYLARYMVCTSGGRWWVAREVGGGYLGRCVGDLTQRCGEAESAEGATLQPTK